MAFPEIDDCGLLDDPLNGVVMFPGGTLEGSQATYTCNLGYEVQGESSRTCDSSSGTWTGSAPTCERESFRVVGLSLRLGC